MHEFTPAFLRPIYCQVRWLPPEENSRWLVLRCSARIRVPHDNLEFTSTENLAIKRSKARRNLKLLMFDMLNLEKKTSEDVIRGVRKKYGHWKIPVTLPNGLDHLALFSYLNDFDWPKKKIVKTRESK